MDIQELKELHDKAYEHNKIVRENAADDLTFYWITQWDDTTLGESTLGYKGEFNIIRRAGRQIIGDLRANPIQVDFEAKNEKDNSGGDLADGMYRSTDRLNTSIESYDNANMESVVCGVGGWELFTEYETNQIGDKNQVIKRRPIHEFNNNAFVDPSAKLMDKSDADYWSILVPYSHEGMEKLADDLTGEHTDADTATFKSPEHSYTFPWVSGQDAIYYAVRFYHRKLIKDKVLTMVDPVGQELLVIESMLSEIMDELIDDGYSIASEKEIERYEVTLYIANGNRILDEQVIAGEMLPVIPQYGERAFVEGQEHYEGVTRLAKDPQRLRNFQMSYLADIVSRSPRPKPIFYAGQIGQFRSMYEENGADNNYPYLLMEEKDAQGNPYPLNPVGQMPEQSVPMALVQSISLSREAVSDVAPVNVSQDLADVDLSGKAVQQLQARLDEQSIVYQQNRKHALRRDGEVWASMAKQVIDSPRTVTLTKPDGTRKSVEIMESVLDRETGEMVVINDLTGSDFEVFSNISASYSTKKEQTMEQLGTMSEKAMTVDPRLAQMLLLKQVQLIDGVDMQDIRDYGNKNMILSGFKEPETEEEMQMMQEAQQGQQPDANMVLAQAEQAKAQADMAEVQRKGQVDQFNAQTDQMETQVKQFDAQTRRLAVQVNAKASDADLDFKRADAFTKRLDAINKPSPLRSSATASYA